MPNRCVAWGFIPQNNIFLKRTDCERLVGTGCLGCSFVDVHCGYTLLSQSLSCLPFDDVLPAVWYAVDQRWSNIPKFPIIKYVYIPAIILE